MLRQTEAGWEFPSETTLEKFVWENLSEFLNIEKLAQQYICNGERCDILGLRKNGQLVIVELKNVEDRYIIQQLTRYHANLLEDQPFSDQIDYSLPIELIAIAPNYHRHNLIDQEYSRLDFTLLNFDLKVKDHIIYFVLQDQQQNIIFEKSVFYTPVVVEPVEGVADPPQKLLTWLSNCTPEEQRGFLKVRSKILSCNPKMKEVIERNYILYQTTKTKICAEIRFHRKSQKPILFLQLPTYLMNQYGQINQKKPFSRRWRMYTDEHNIIAKGLVKEGFEPKIPKKAFCYPEGGYPIQKFEISQELSDQGFDSWDIVAIQVTKRFAMVEYKNSSKDSNP